METKTKEAVIKELREELDNILPFGEKCNDQTVLDARQFICPYLDALKNRMLELYPHNKEKIEEVYDHIHSDVWGEGII